jgi:hypothetical protein
MWVLRQGTCGCPRSGGHNNRSHDNEVGDSTPRLCDNSWEESLVVFRCLPPLSRDVVVLYSEWSPLQLYKGAVRQMGPAVSGLKRLWHPRR